MKGGGDSLTSGFVRSQSEQTALFLAVGGRVWKVVFRTRVRYVTLNLTHSAPAAAKIMLMITHLRPYFIEIMPRTTLILSLTGLKELRSVSSVTWDWWMFSSVNILFLSVALISGSGDHVNWNRFFLLWSFLLFILANKKYLPNAVCMLMCSSYLPSKVYLKLIRVWTRQIKWISLEVTAMFLFLSFHCSSAEKHRPTGNSHLVLEILCTKQDATLESE